MSRKSVRIVEVSRTPLLIVVAAGIAAATMVSYAWANPDIRRREIALVVGALIVVCTVMGVVSQLARRFALIRGTSDSLEYYPKWYSVRPVKVTENLHALTLTVNTLSESEVRELPGAMSGTIFSIDLAGDGVSFNLIRLAKHVNPDIADRFQDWSNNVVDSHGPDRT